MVVILIWIVRVMAPSPLRKLSYQDAYHRPRLLIRRKRIKAIVCLILQVFI